MGLTIAPVTAGRVKDMMDEPTNRANNQLIGQLVAEGLISESYLMN